MFLSITLFICLMATAPHILETQRIDVLNLESRTSRDYDLLWAAAVAAEVLALVGSSKKSLTKFLSDIFNMNE